MSVQIKPVAADEIDSLVQLSISTFYDTFHQDNTPENLQQFLDENMNKQVLQQERNDPGNQFYFAKIDNEIVGYIKLSLKNQPKELPSSQALEIARIYVAASKKNHGIGKALFNFAKQQAVSKNLNIIWLGVWEHNVKAIAFYLKLGFVKFGEHTFMVGKDQQNDWLMKLSLP